MPRFELKADKPYTSSATRPCQHCNRILNVKGHTSHEKACKARLENLRRDLAYEAELAVQAAQTAEYHEMDVDVEMQDPDSPDVDIRAQSVNNNDMGIGHSDYSERQQTPEVSSFSPVTPERPSPYQIDDIKVEYHPNSGRKPAVHHFDEYQRQKSSCNIPLEEEPWRPFVCHNDFEFARIAMEAALKPVHVNALITLISKIGLGEKFTLINQSRLSKIWKLAAKKLTPFKEENITVPYKKGTRSYSVWFRPLWDWTLDLLHDSRVAPHMVWDAERTFKYDGSKFVRFFDEPWTGDRFWDIQSALTNGNPLCWIVYADKNKLSSFGTEQGYPVIVRCANIPTEIRNGKGIGGGRVMGWLPILSSNLWLVTKKINLLLQVKDPTANRKKVSWTNHKRAVWHAAMKKILESIAAYSESGHWYDGADGVRRKIHPCIMMLSGDYEEQTFMTLIRGVKGLFPCPRCLVPANQQADLSITVVLRTQAETKDLIDSLSTSTKAVAEEKLKAKGLRNLTNAFWDIKNSDPYESVSWDRLHSYSSGIFGGHMWSDFKLLFKEIGRPAEKQIDNQFDLIPRFRDLHHFKDVIPICFNDGSKFESLAKQLLYAAHNVLTPRTSRHGYIFLQCLRIFLVLDTYLSFEVHTEITINAGRQELLRFSKLISAYIGAVPEVTKFSFTTVWDFIKMHLQFHAFDDIEAKGVTRNYNTKPNESLHKPLRDAYHLRTNFKEVAKQILRADHYLLVSALIKDKITDLVEHDKSEDQSDEMELEKDLDAREDPPLSCHYYLGSANRVSTVSELEALHGDDVSFRFFRRNLTHHLNTFFSAYSIPLPYGKRIYIPPYHQIMEYKLLKVNYESKVTWKEMTDILRCSPSFHKRPRYDSVIYRTVNGFIFGRLICLIGYKVGDKEYHAALVQPCDAPIGRPLRKDIDLGLVRVKAKPRASSEVISVHTIVRGAVLVPDFDRRDEFLVMDILDTDMFLRVKEIQSSAR